MPRKRVYSDIIPSQSATIPTDDAFISKLFPEYEQQCHWPHTAGVAQTLYYLWGSGLTTPGTGWRNAFEAAINSWNIAGTGFTLTENAASSTITMMLYSANDNRTGQTLITCNPGGSVLAHADVQINTFVVTTPNTSPPAHEIGHAQGLGHIASNGALMRYDTGGFFGPQPLDIELIHIIYP